MSSRAVCPVRSIRGDSGALSCGIDRRYLPTDNCPRVLDLYGCTSALQRGIDTTRCAGQRTPREHCGVCIATVSHNLFVNRGIICERRKGKPEIQITLSVSARRLQSADARRRELAALTRQQRLRIPTHSRCLLRRQDCTGESARQVESQCLRGSAIQVPGATESAIDLELEQRLTRLIVETPVNRPAIVIQTRERLLRRHNPFGRRINRGRLNATQPRSRA